MKNRILLTVLILLMGISLVGCAWFGLRTNKTSASVQATSSDEQSATETRDSIADEKAESATVPKATLIPETTEEQTEPEMTKPSATEPAVEMTKPPQTPQPTKPTEPQETQPTESVPPQQTEPPRQTEPEETEPPVTQEPTTPPAQPVQIDTAAIEAYARAYAQSLGFTIDTSLGKGNGGYYSPDYCILDSMEAGYRSAVGMTNATKNQLNSRFSAESCDVLVESIYGLVRYNCKVVYSHTDELGSWYYVYVFYG